MSDIKSKIVDMIVNGIDVVSADQEQWNHFVRFCASGNIYNFSLLAAIIVVGKKGKEYDWKSSVIGSYDDWKKVENPVHFNAKGIKVPSKNNFNFPYVTKTENIFTYNETVARYLPKTWINDDLIKSDDIFKNNLSSYIDNLTQTYVRCKMKVGTNYGESAIKAREDVMSVLLKLRCGIDCEIPPFPFVLADEKHIHVNDIIIFLNELSDGYHEYSRLLRQSLTDSEFLSRIKGGMDNELYSGDREQAYSDVQEREEHQGRDGILQTGRGNNDISRSGQQLSGIRRSGRESEHGEDSGVVRQIRKDAIELSEQELSKSGDMVLDQRSFVGKDAGIQSNVYGGSSSESRSDDEEREDREFHTESEQILPTGRSGFEGYDSRNDRGANTSQRTVGDEYVQLSLFSMAFSDYDSDSIVEIIPSDNISDDGHIIDREYVNTSEYDLIPEDYGTYIHPASGKADDYIFSLCLDRIGYFDLIDNNAENIEKVLAEHCKDLAKTLEGSSSPDKGDFCFKGYDCSSKGIYISWVFNGFNYRELYNWRQFISKSLKFKKITERPSFEMLLALAKKEGIHNKTSYDMSLCINDTIKDNDGREWTVTDVTYENYKVVNNSCPSVANAFSYNDIRDIVRLVPENRRYWIPKKDMYACFIVFNGFFMVTEKDDISSLDDTLHYPEDPFEDCERAWEIVYKIRDIFSKNSMAAHEFSDLCKGMSQREFVEFVDKARVAPDKFAEQINILLNKKVDVISDITRKKDLPENSKKRSIDEKKSYYGYTQSEGGPKVKYQVNVNAIKCLKGIESEKRYATVEEQQILARYSGWGGISKAFDVLDSSWESEYKELKNILNEEEYLQAFESVNSSFYTSEMLIESMYSTAKGLGIAGGNILDPSMGTGNFYSCIPDEFKHAKLYGSEIDSITSRIAKQLHPECEIFQGGFEKANFEKENFDLIISNVPFVSYTPYDSDNREINTNHFVLHDYFFAKSIDLLKDNGIISFITSAKTLDKKSSKLREYLAERCELLGAVRLPNTAFNNAGTKVTTDIIYIRKNKAIVPDTYPSWCYTSPNGNGQVINNYFIEHPEMVLGNIVANNRFGDEKDSICEEIPGTSLNELLSKATKEILLNNKKIAVNKKAISKEKEDDGKIPAVPQIKNYTFGIVNDEIFYRTNNYMEKISFSNKKSHQLFELIKIRTAARTLISAEADENTPDQDLVMLRTDLNTVYDQYSSEFGNLHDSLQIFSADDDYPLMDSLEKLVDDSYVKADIFHQRTILPMVIPTHADSIEDALNICISYKGKLDFGYISSLTGMNNEKIKDELIASNLIYRNSDKVVVDQELSGYETADEYLSGNVRKKLHRVQFLLAKNHDLYAEYERNLHPLEESLPEWIEASDIVIKIGTSWIELEDYDLFMHELFKIPKKYNPYENGASIYSRNQLVRCEKVKINERYFIQNKTMVSYTETMISTYGTKRISAIEIFEQTLNLKTVKVFDIVGDTKVVNTKETLLAQSKQELIKQKFSEWIFSDVERREKYVEYYNETFNCIRLRQYDGSSMFFPGLAAGILPKKHQKNGVARIIRSSNNTLLGHCVGAGKSFELIAACMEMRRLELAKKPLIVVPNTLTGQMAEEFKKFYPTSKVLLVTEKDFSKQGRRKFLARIMTGDYDAIVMGHSQLTLCPLSIERRKKYMLEEKEKLQATLQMADNNKEHWSSKQIALMLKRLEKKYDKVVALKQDAFTTFEELGIDCLIIDEAHEFKNLSLTTKLSNVAGLNTAGAMKSDDLMMKIQYLKEATGKNNIVFATGTPISNSMCEAYTLMQYLAEDMLDDMGIHNFDAWVNTFGEVSTSLELTPEGNGFRQRTRLSKFSNLTELSSLYCTFADIVTKDHLDIKIPELKNGKETVVECEPDVYIKSEMGNLVDRAESIHSGKVAPDVDNMLCITNDAKNLGLDARLYNISAPDYKGSKLHSCINKIYDIYVQENERKGTQAVFCDRGTPTLKRKEPQPEDENQESDDIMESAFCVYDFIKDELIKKGIPAEEIAYIHDASTADTRKVLFAKVNNGAIRVILGSTKKLGTGANIQERLCAMHELDIPWRPSDIEQREGRGLRQGNSYDEVEVLRYITVGTFDAYNWQTVETKQKFISQFQAGTLSNRTFEDIDTKSMSYGQMKAIASGNPLIQEKAEIENRLMTLKMLHSSWKNEQYRIDSMVKKILPQKISQEELRIEGICNDIEKIKGKDNENLDIRLSINNMQPYEDSTQAGTAFFDVINGLKVGDAIEIGTINGFELEVTKSTSVLEDIKTTIFIKGNNKYSIEPGNSFVGNIQKFRNFFTTHIYEIRDNHLRRKEGYVTDMEEAKANLDKPFEQEKEYNTLLSRYDELTQILTIDDNGYQEDKGKERL